MHFLLRNPELPGGRLPDVAAGNLPPYLDGDRADAQGTGGCPFQDFFPGVILGIYQAETGDAHLHVLGIELRFPCKGNGNVRILVADHGVGCREDGLGGSRIGPQPLFMACGSGGGRLRRAGSIEIHGSGERLGILAEHHVTVNSPAVRILGHFSGNDGKRRPEAGFLRLGDHLRQDETARVAIGFHVGTGESLLENFPGFPYFLGGQVQDGLRARTWGTGG